MKYNEALDYMQKIKLRGSHPGMERITTLLDLIGNPHKNLSFIHIAGTNGKGSVCLMTESILRTAGYKTGLFTSPYILRFNESMRINGTEISDNEFADITEYVRSYAESMSSLPTEFEILTAIALEYFKRNRCNIVIMETGMGGRLDSTNIADKVMLSVITDVDMDHMSFLGDTIEKIAFEKAGIIKPYCPVIFGGENQSALHVIKNKAKECHSELITVNHNNMKNLYFSPYGFDFDFCSLKNVHLPLAGIYQKKNAAVVMTIFQELKKVGVSVSDKAIYDGLKNLVWNGRFEILSKKPFVIFDGAHNPQGINSAVETLKTYFPNKKINILMGVMADKNYDDMIDLLKCISNNVFTITPNNPRSLNASALADAFLKKEIKAKAFKNINSAVDYACEVSKNENTPLMILGSLYMYADIKKYF